MGLFSARRRLARPFRFRVPIRLHSEAPTPSVPRFRSGRVARQLAAIATSAANDARVVSALFVVAAVALALGMAFSLGLL